MWKRFIRVDGALVSKTTTLHVYHAFLYISSPSLYDYDVTIRSFSNDAADGNENVNVHHAFFKHFFAVVVRLRRENA